MCLWEGIFAYEYDEIGNLEKDLTEGITDIDWTVYGKIKTIAKNSGNLTYHYDPSGNRIRKTVGEKNTWYVRDAQGNTLAVYDKTGTAPVYWREQQLYGSTRLGTWKPDIAEATGDALMWDIAGKKSYELNNHLGNVMVVVSDNIELSSGLYVKDVQSATDYYAFGSAMPGRSVNLAGYRYGFNGKENDNDVGKGDGNQQDYGMRIYDGRIGKFLSVDPLLKDYPWYTPYQFAGNKPIWAVDLDGLEELPFQTHMSLYPNQPTLGLSSFIVDWYTNGLRKIHNGARNLVQNEQEIEDPSYNEKVPDKIKTLRYENRKTQARAEMATGVLEWYGANHTLMSLPMGFLEGGQLFKSGVDILRQNTARSFYAKFSYKVVDMLDHIRGIDFSKPVDKIILPKGTRLLQWVGENGTGSYFTSTSNGAAKNLGINYEGRTLTEFILDKNVEVLKSTAKEMDGKAGGGIQYFSPELKGAAKPVK